MGDGRSRRHGGGGQVARGEQCPLCARRPASRWIAISGSASRRTATTRTPRPCTAARARAARGTWRSTSAARPSGAAAPAPGPSTSPRTSCPASGSRSPPSSPSPWLCPTRSPRRPSPRRRRPRRAGAPVPSGTGSSSASGSAPRGLAPPTPRTGSLRGHPAHARVALCAGTRGSSRPGSRSSPDHTSWETSPDTCAGMSGSGLPKRIPAVDWKRCTDLGLALCCWKKQKCTSIADIFSYFHQ